MNSVFFVGAATVTLMRSSRIRNRPYSASGPAPSPLMINTLTWHSFSAASVAWKHRRQIGVLKLIATAFWPSAARAAEPPANRPNTAPDVSPVPPG